MSNKYGLTEDQLSIQEMAKKFADEVVAETVTDLDARHAFPEEEVKQCAGNGIFRNLRTRRIRRCRNGSLKQCSCY